jgi:hypothetical protein
MEKRSRRALVGRALLGLAVVALVAMRGGPAGASMSGPCTASVNGQDVAPLSASSPSDAIDVGSSDTVRVQAQSTTSIGEYRIQLEYAGIRWTVAKGQATDNQWSRDVNVDDYARYGAGLYRVHGVSDGAASCDGAVLIKVGGQPLATPAGIVATVFVLIGAANAVMTVRRGRSGVTA